MPQSTVPYIGSKISLISNSEIRYEGILYTINTQESTIALQSVRCFGTEGRKMPEIPPSSEVYDFIIFRGQDIKDLTVLEACNAVNDPAIVSINQRPAGGKGAQAEKGGDKGSGPSAGKAQPKGGRSAGGGRDAINNIFNSAKSGGGRKGDDYGSSGQKGWGRDSSSDWGSSWWSSGRDGWSGWGAGTGSKGKDYGWSSGSGGWSSGKGSGSGQKGWSSEPQKGSKAQKGGKSADTSKGKGKTSGKASKGTEKGSGKTRDSGNTGGRRGGSGSATTGVPVGELVPEDNAEAKKEFAEEFDYGASNDKFDKVTTSEGVDGLEDRLKPLPGYDKSKSFFDSISCEATERAGENDRQKVDRDKARQFDRETFGDTRRPPRPTGGRPGKGRRKGGPGGKGGFR